MLIRKPRIELLAELELSPVRARGGLIVAETSGRRTARRWRTDALDPVPDHELEPARATLTMGCQILDREVHRARHERDLLQLIAAIRDRRRDRVVLALMRERALLNAFKMISSCSSKSSRLASASSMGLPKLSTSRVW